MSSNESKLLRAAFIPTFLTSGFAILISTFVVGFPGFLGAVLAQFVVIIFFIIHIAVSRMTRNLDPISTMAMALFSYFAKLFALGLLLWVIARYTERSTIDRMTFGITAVGQDKLTSIAEAWQFLPQSGSACDEDDLSFDYGIDGGMRNFFCRALTVYSWKAFIASAPVPPFLSGPHRDGKLELNSEDEFGYYNPKFVIWATNAIGDVPELVEQMS